MRSDIRSLWARFELKSTDAAVVALVETDTSHNVQIFDALYKEFDRCVSEKCARLGGFVEDLRSQIRELWVDLMTGEEEIKLFEAHMADGK